MRRLYCVSCRPVRAPAFKVAGLGTGSDVQQEHKWFCTYCVIVMSGHEGSRVQGRTILSFFFLYQSETATRKILAIFLTMSQVNLTCLSLVEGINQGINGT